MNTPRFSVVIPTVDRAHLLGGAIESALGQTESDLEVVVVDNGSEDETAIVARGSGDPRVRYVRRADRHLMHDNWRYAMTQTHGEFVTVLCDDDALHPRALERAVDAAERHDAEVVCWRACTHYLNTWDGPQRGQLQFGPPYADRPFRIDGAKLLDLAFAMRVTFTDLVPKLLNTIVTRALLERSDAARGELFPPTACPDYSAMLGLAARARSIVLLDAPLTVTGAGPLSIGASSERRGDSARSFLAELRAGADGLILPTAVGPRVTWLAQTLMQSAASDYVHEGRVVDTVNLYGLAGIEIAQAEVDGLDVATERDDYEAALNGPLASDADAIRAFVAERREIACESYLTPIPGGEAVLGLGAFRADDLDAAAVAGARTADVAAVVDAWLSREAERLAPLLETLSVRAGDRTIVLFGLGRNGRALRRVWPDGRNAAVVDDRADRMPPGVERLAADHLDPRHHFVVVTPANAEPIMERLQGAGFVPDADVVAIASRGKSSAASSIRNIDRSAAGR